MDTLSPMYDDEEQDDLCIASLMLSQAVKEFGARALWVELKNTHPTQFNELLYYALDMLKK